MKLKSLATQEAIRDGRITVNHKTVKNPDHELRINDKVIVGGRLIVITGKGEK